MTTTIPMPGDVDEAYADFEPSRLFNNARRYGAIEWVEPQEVSAAMGWSHETAPAPQRYLLTLRRVAAPCPYVGPPQRFEWDVLEDPAGRCIADSNTRRIVDYSRALISNWQSADDEPRR